MIGGLIAAFFFMLFFGWISDHFSKIKILLFVLFGFSSPLVPLYQLLGKQHLCSLQLFL